MKKKKEPISYEDWIILLRKRIRETCEFSDEEINFYFSDKEELKGRKNEYEYHLKRYLSGESMLDDMRSAISGPAYNIVMCI